MEFIKPAAPILVDELTDRGENEVSLPPPEWATGFAHDQAGTIRKELESSETKVVPKFQEYFMDRLLIIHGILDILTQEQEHIKMAKE